MDPKKMMNDNSKSNIEKEVKVSVIIPMYKCADFIEDCLEQVCGQTFRDMEIICVLDGPDEKVRSVIGSWMKNDDRIILLEQVHAGAGAARNTGLEKARGEYLLFLDADDLFSQELVEKLYREAVKWDADTVMCSYIHTNEREKTRIDGFGFDASVFPEGKVIDPAEIEWLYCSLIDAPWNKLFRHKMIKDEGLRFSETTVMNDGFFVLAALTSSKRLAVIHEDLLTARRHVNSESISSNRHKHTEDCAMVTRQLREWLVEKGYWEQRKDDFIRKTKYMMTYNTSYDLNEKFIDELAKLFSLEKPWKKMSNAQLVDVMELKTDEFIKQRQTIADEISYLGDDSPLPGRRYRLKSLDNNIEAYEEIRSVMKNKYGRDLNKRDNPFVRLRESVISEGWSKTIRMIFYKIKGPQVLEPDGVVCAGHITSAGGFITFFLPVSTRRKTAKFEDLDVVVRCNGYYVLAASGEDGKTLTKLGHNRTGITRKGKPIRSGEISGVYAYVTDGMGIQIQIRFKRPLLRNEKGGKAHNNHPVSVTLYGKIILK